MEELKIIAMDGNANKGLAIEDPTIPMAGDAQGENQKLQIFELSLNQKVLP